MAVVILGLPEDGLPRYNGRPDLDYRRSRGEEFGVTYAKKFPPYVYSANGMGALVHKVANVKLDWYAVGGRGLYLVRLPSPIAFAHTVCGCTRFIEYASARERTWRRTKKKVPAKMCIIPRPDAVLCGRCHGEVATFGPDGAGTKVRLTRKLARERLGCVIDSRDIPNTEISV